MALENVTSTASTGVFLGFGVTAATEVMIGGVSSTNTLKVVAGETLPAASIGRDHERVGPVGRFSAIENVVPVTVA